jgi:hypothetical protein
MKRESKAKIVSLQETKEVYQAPVIETVEVRVELGFQATGIASPDDDDRNEGNKTW